MPITLPQCSGRAASGRHSHSSCDRSPIHHLQSLLHHPVHCGGTVKPAVQDKTRLALLPLLFRQLRLTGLHLITRMAPDHLLLGKGPGDAMCFPREVRPARTGGVPDLPPQGVRDLHVSPGPSSARDRTPTRGSGTAACLATAGTRKILTCRAHGMPPTEGRTSSSDDHAARKDWQDADTISARPRMISTTAATPNAMPHSVLSTVSDHCTPRFEGK